MPTRRRTLTRRRKRRRVATTLRLALERKPLHCSPIVEKRGHVPGSCFTEDAIRVVKKEFNAAHPDTPIREVTPVNIQARLQKSLSSKCADEKCWLNEIPDARMRSRLTAELYVPSQPRDWKPHPTSWLSNFDIINVLRQYEKAYPEFHLLGPTTLDYNTVLSNGMCVDEELCHVTLRGLLDEKKSKLAVSFNLSKHDEPGTHWTTLFVDLTNKFVYYYDSALNTMPIQIVRYKNDVIKQAASLGIRLRFHKNRHQHQRTNTECGMYSLFFTIVMLTGKMGTTVLSPRERVRLFSQTVIPDHLMIQLRSIYFYPDN